VILAASVFEISWGKPTNRCKNTTHSTTVGVGSKTKHTVVSALCKTPLDDCNRQNSLTICFFSTQFLSFSNVCPKQTIFSLFPLIEKIPLQLSVVPIFFISFRFSRHAVAALVLSFLMHLFDFCQKSSGSIFRIHKMRPAKLKVSKVLVFFSNVVTFPTNGKWDGAP